MNKILLNVKVPIIEKDFDVFVPANKNISRVILLLNKAINEMTDGTYIFKKNSILCNATTGAMYNNQALVRDSGLENGSKVILV